MLAPDLAAAAPFDLGAAGVPLTAEDADRILGDAAEADGFTLRERPQPKACDLAAAARFLDLVAEGEPCTFQTFDDGPRKRPQLARVMHGTLEEHGAELTRLNAAGAGVFWMVNYGDGKGRTADNVTGIRALFVDLDGAPLAPVQAPSSEPHAVIESSPGKWHAYWLVADCAPSQFTALQKALAARFGGDGAVCDLPRVMRLPGFLHRKGEPFASRIVALRPLQPYPVADLVRGLGLELDAVPVRATVQAGDDRVQAGGRNNMLAREAGKLRRVGLAADELDAALQAVNARRCDPPLAPAEVSGIARSVARYEPGENAAADDGGPPLPVALDLRALDASDPPPPAFVVPGLIPQGEVTLFAGHGGAGKSYVALHLGACIAAGRDWYSMPTARRRVLWLSLEDGRERLHWRLRRVCDWLGLRMGDLAGELAILDGSECDGALMREAQGAVHLTELSDWLRAEVARTGAQVLIVDGASDAFDANEIVRRYVRRFIRALRAMIPRDGAVILTAHVNADTARNPVTAQGFSGSTAWHNSARARLYLRPDGDSGDLLLESHKVQDARPGGQVRIRWNETAQVFVGEGGAHAGPLARGLADAEASEWLRSRIAEAHATGAAVPSATTGRRTAYHVLSARDDFPQALRGDNGRARFWGLIERLRAAGAIEEASEPGPSRHPKGVFHARNTCG